MRTFRSILIAGLVLVFAGYAWGQFVGGEYWQDDKYAPPYHLFYTSCGSDVAIWDSNSMLTCDPGLQWDTLNVKVSDNDNGIVSYSITNTSGGASAGAALFLNNTIGTGEVTLFSPAAGLADALLIRGSHHSVVIQAPDATNGTVEVNPGNGVFLADWMTGSGTRCVQVSSTGQVTPAAGPCASGGTGTVTNVTGTAPIFITGTSTVTPNVTIQGAIVTGSTSTTAQNLGTTIPNTNLVACSTSGSVCTPVGVPQATFQPAGNYITSLNHDVIATGPGSAAAEVVGITDSSSIDWQIGGAFSNGKVLGFVTGTLQAVSFQAPLTACTDYVSLSCVTGATDIGGTNATPTVIGIESTATMRGDLVATAISAPSTPASGKAAIYVDSTSKNLAVKNDAGTVNHGVQTNSCTNQFVSAVADNGTTTCSSVTCADLPAFTGQMTTAGGTCATTIPDLYKSKINSGDTAPDFLIAKLTSTTGSVSIAALGGIEVNLGVVTAGLFGGPRSAAFVYNYLGRTITGGFGGLWAMPGQNNTGDTDGNAYEMGVEFAATAVRIVANVTCNTLSATGYSGVTFQVTKNGSNVIGAVTPALAAGGGCPTPGVIRDSGAVAVTGSAGDRFGMLPSGSNTGGGAFSASVTLYVYQ